MLCLRTLEEIAGPCCHVRLLITKPPSLVTYVSVASGSKAHTSMDYGPVHLGKRAVVKDIPPLSLFMEL